MLPHLLIWVCITPVIYYSFRFKNNIFDANISIIIGVDTYGAGIAVVDIMIDITVTVAVGTVVVEVVVVGTAVVGTAAEVGIVEVGTVVDIEVFGP